MIASETHEQTLLRQEQDRICTASMRASEIYEQTLRRQEQNRTRMASMIASETHEQTLLRQEQDRICTASMRASETHEQTLRRQEQNRTRMASMIASETHQKTLLRQEHDRICMRASETHEQTLLRQEQNRTRMASMIASETREQTLRRQEQDRTHRANKKNRSLLVEDAIAAFRSEIKLGPDFVCTRCHRMMYRKSVLCNKVKYTKTSADVLQKVFSADLSFISSGGEELICKTCDRSLSRGYMPVQAKANGLQLCEVPPELSDLNPLELRLICLCLPFMKMVAFPSGKQRSIHGPAVNVPSKVDTICNVLPRLPCQTELVPIKLKRKLSYRGHYMYDYITPQKPINALQFLKGNNSLLTLGAHARGLQYLFCLCVCVCVFPILAPRAIRRTNSSISDFSAIRA